MINPSFIMFKRRTPGWKLGGSVRIVFWGSERGCCVTSNMLILSAYLACKKGYRIALLELAEEKRGILRYFPRKKMRYAADYIRTLVDRHLYYASLAEWQEQKKGPATVIDMIKQLESNMDMVFVNLANRTDNEAKDLMRNAHLLVVNLKQELRAFDSFYARYANLSTNVLLMIGNYYEDGVCEKEMLQKKYCIPEEMLVVIPNNPEYEMACAEYHLERYLRRNKKTWMSVRKYYFWKELEKTAELLCEAVKKR